MSNPIPAKKSLGQNFLINEGVLDHIITAAQLQSSDTVVEVGPGRGALTQRLAASGARVIAIEKDHRLIDSLRETFAPHPNVTIIAGDILEFDPLQHNLQPHQWKLVANIPYYLTGHLLRLLSESWPQPARSVLMVQREVADRLRAHPPEMNMLALAVQLTATPSLVCRVSRGSFRPMPSVDSAVVLLTPRAPVIPPAVVTRALALARPAFMQKRKKLTATLDADTLTAAHIDPNARPQELATEDWVRLATGLL